MVSYYLFADLYVIYLLTSIHAIVPDFDNKYACPITYRYRIMLCCWEPNPKSRPQFEDLVHLVRKVIITLEQAHQQVGLDITYVNVPTSQSYLYPRSNSEEPSPIVQNHLNNNNSHYHQQQVTQTGLAVGSGSDTLRSVTGSRSTMV